MLIQDTNMSRVNLRNAELELILLKNVNLAGADLRNANLTMIMMIGVDLSDANLERIKYDKFSLQNLLNSKLNGTRMSEDLKNDLESLRAM
jgi:uncharacterized protein YjbI with pentapeptide repeats